MMICPECEKEVRVCAPLNNYYCEECGMVWDMQYGYAYPKNSSVHACTMLCVAKEKFINTLIETLSPFFVLVLEFLDRLITKIDKV